MTSEYIKFVFEHGTLVEKAANGLHVVLEQAGISNLGFTFSGKPLSMSRLASMLQKMEYPNFDVEGHGFSFSCGSLASPRLDFLKIMSRDSKQIPFEKWADQFVNSTDFIMAWIADTEYDYWQNANDPLEYTSVGKQYDHLPMKSNGLPYPLERQIIDISANPGRWCFRKGYIEAVGSTMWLGEKFWSLTGTRRSRVDGASFLTVDHPTSSLTQIKISDHCFTSSKGDEGDLQNKLRALLFTPEASSCE